MALFEPANSMLAPLAKATTTVLFDPTMSSHLQAPAKGGGGGGLTGTNKRRSRAFKCQTVAKFLCLSQPGKYSQDEQASSCCAD